MGRRFVYHDLAVDPADLIIVGGVRVTSPDRTLADLARVADDEHSSAARLLSEDFPGLAERALAWFDAHGRLPNKRSAVAFLRGLAACAAQDEVTRYTS